MRIPIVKRKDEQTFGNHYTKKMVLHIHDQMQEAIVTGTAYQTILLPPPADPCVAHPASEVLSE